MADETNTKEIHLTTVAKKTPLQEKEVADETNTKEIHLTTLLYQSCATRFGYSIGESE